MPESRMGPLPRDCDLLILGAGFAGSVTALIARRLGLSVVLVDRARHPRFAIGESSTPAGNMILASLARRFDLPELEPLARYGTWKEARPDLDVGPKRGFSYFRHLAGRVWRQEPEHAAEFLVAASHDPWACDTHWRREDVDAWLLDRAREAGSLGVEGMSVVRVDGSGMAGWKAVLDSGDAVRARLLVDATGTAGLAAALLDIPPGPPMRTMTSASFTHVTGLPTWESASGLDASDHPFPCDQAALHHVGEDGWVWELRFDSGITSVGCVTTGAFAPDLEAWINRFPDLARRWRAAELAPRPGRMLRADRLQRRVAVAGGPNWALLPSAAGFVDPLHSTGIAHTLAGIERLAGTLASGSTDFTTFGERVLLELDGMDRLVALCYTALPDFRGFCASTMLYFWGSIRYERTRMRLGNGPGGLFLALDDSLLLGLLEGAEQRVGRPGYADWLYGELGRLDAEGVLSPAIANMYPHTVPPGW